jgi:hypothetical protein
MKKSKLENPNFAAIIGFLFALPFFIINFIVALRIEPLYSILGAYPALRNTPILPLLLLLLFPIGACISAYPMFQGKQKIYITNTIVVIVLMVVFFILFYALGEELYRCEIAKIPNCD